MTNTTTLPHHLVHYMTTNTMSLFLSPLKISSYTCQACLSSTPPPPRKMGPSVKEGAGCWLSLASKARPDRVVHPIAVKCSTGDIPPDRDPQNAIWSISCVNKEVLCTSPWHMRCCPTLSPFGLLSSAAAFPGPSAPFGHARTLIHTDLTSSLTSRVDGAAWISPEGMQYDEGDQIY